jgi:hypothetical protein
MNAVVREDANTVEAIGADTAFGRLGKFRTLLRSLRSSRLTMPAGSSAESARRPVARGFNQAEALVKIISPPNLLSIRAGLGGLMMKAMVVGLRKSCR